MPVVSVRENAGLAAARQAGAVSAAALHLAVGLFELAENAVGFWEQGKARPKGRNREALVALRKLGKREVAGIVASKGEGVRREAKGGASGRKKRQ